MEEYLNKFWEKYSFIHNSTKELYILSEEYDDELSSFIQPIKEQRDSLEHIVRAYSRYSSIDVISDDDENEDKKYIAKNLDKAIGHIFRSFFDCADVLSIILRERLSNELSKFSYTTIVKAWPNYEESRRFLVEMPKNAAQLRIDKDVAKTNDEVEVMIKTYKSNIDKLFEIYKHYMLDVYPVLNK